MSRAAKWLEENPRSAVPTVQRFQRARTQQPRLVQLWLSGRRRLQSRRRRRLQGGGGSRAAGRRRRER
jgi:hypothetical protein